MITYIVVSYIIMSIWAIVAMIRGKDTTKDILKMWALSPVTLPILLFIRFLEW